MFALWTSVVPAAEREARLIPVTVYGVDERSLSSALLDETDEQRYSATQLISCKSGRGKPLATVGNLAGDFSHGIGVAHGFDDKQARKSVTAGDCRFL